MMTAYSITLQSSKLGKIIPIRKVVSVPNGYSGYYLHTDIHSCDLLNP